MAADANTPHWIRLAGIGALAGLFASLFGVGGGIVMVPLLVLLLGYDAKVATATSLAAIILTATVGGATHAVLGNVAWEYSLLVGLPAVLGVLLGLGLKDRLSSVALTRGFAGLLIAVAAWLVFKQTPSPDVVATLEWKEAFGVAVLGVLAGSLAGLFGVGGGILFVPALTLIAGLPQLVAEGASLLAIIPVSILGSWRQHKAGTVDWRAAAIIGLASVGTAVAGAFLADATPSRALQVLFATLMIATAIQIVARTRRKGPGDPPASEI